MITPLELHFLNAPLHEAALLPGILRLSHYRHLRRWYQYLLQPSSLPRPTRDIQSTTRIALLLPAPSPLREAIHEAIKILDPICQVISESALPLSKDVLTYYQFLLQDRHQAICRLLYFSDAYRLQELAEHPQHLPRQPWRFPIHVAAPHIPCALQHLPY